jgi:hypothetical protein
LGPEGFDCRAALGRRAEAPGATIRKKMSKSDRKKDKRQDKSKQKHKRHEPSSSSSRDSYSGSESFDAMPASTRRQQEQGYEEPVIYDDGYQCEADYYPGDGYEGGAEEYDGGQAYDAPTSAPIQKEIKVNWSTIEMIAVAQFKVSDLAMQVSEKGGNGQLEFTRSTNMTLGHHNKQDMQVAGDKKAKREVDIVKRLYLKNMTTNYPHALLITVNIPTFEGTGSIGGSKDVRYVVMPGELSATKPRTIEIFNREAKFTPEIFAFLDAFPGLTPERLDKGIQPVKSKRNKNGVKEKVHNISMSHPLVTIWNLEQSEKAKQVVEHKGASMGGSGRTFVSDAFVKKFKPRVQQKMREQISYADVTGNLKMTIAPLRSTKDGQPVTSAIGFADSTLSAYGMPGGIKAATEARNEAQIKAFREKVWDFNFVLCADYIKMGKNRPIDLGTA